MASKTTPKKKTSKVEEILTVSEYASAFGLTEAFVRNKLKKGELESSELIKNGRKVLGIKVSNKGKEQTAQDKPSEMLKAAPKLVKLDSLKTVNYQNIISEKENEIIEHKAKLMQALENLEQKDNEVKNLHEAIRVRTKQVQALEERIKEIEGKQNQAPVTPQLIAVQEVHAEKKKVGFFASLFGKK